MLPVGGPIEERQHHAFGFRISSDLDSKKKTSKETNKSRQTTKFSREGAERFRNHPLNPGTERGAQRLMRASPKPANHGRNAVKELLENGWIQQEHLKF